MMISGAGLAIVHPPKLLAVTLVLVPRSWSRSRIHSLLSIPVFHVGIRSSWAQPSSTGIGKGHSALVISVAVPVRMEHSFNVLSGVGRAWCIRST